MKFPPGGVPSGSDHRIDAAGQAGHVAGGVVEITDPGERGCGPEGDFRAADFIAGRVKVYGPGDRGQVVDRPETMEG